MNRFQGQNGNNNQNNKVVWMKLLMLLQWWSKATNTNNTKHTNLPSTMNHQACKANPWALIRPAHWRQRWGCLNVDVHSQIRQCAVSMCSWHMQNILWFDPEIDVVLTCGYSISQSETKCGASKSIQILRNKLLYGQRYSNFDLKVIFVKRCKKMTNARLTIATPRGRSTVGEPGGIDSAAQVWVQMRALHQFETESK